jgi:thiamine pyrophosphokinase
VVTPHRHRGSATDPSNLHRAMPAEGAMGVPPGEVHRAPDGGPAGPPRRTAVVLAGGATPHAEVPADVGPAPLVVAADSGVHLAERLGLVIDLVVGDLDSVEPDALDRARRSGAVVEAHPADKDASDLELAIEAAAVRGAERLVVLGLHGGRVDHHLANLLLLASPRWRVLRIEAHGVEGRMVVVHDHVELRAEPGSLCTLLPVGGPALGVRTTGLRWALEGDDLDPGTTRGLSNVFEASVATVSIAGGTLLAVLPASEPTVTP